MEILRACAYKVNSDGVGREDPLGDKVNSAIGEREDTLGEVERYADNRRKPC